MIEQESSDYESSAPSFSQISLTKKRGRPKKNRSAAESTEARRLQLNKAAKKQRAKASTKAYQKKWHAEQYVTARQRDQEGSFALREKLAYEAGFAKGFYTAFDSKRVDKLAESANAGYEETNNLIQRAGYDSRAREQLAVICSRYLLRVARRAPTTKLPNFNNEATGD